DFRYVSKAGAPSRNPYHMATTCGRPSAPTVATAIEWRSCRKASTSSSVILMRSRTLAMCLFGSLQELGCHRAVGLTDGIAEQLQAVRAHDPVDQVGGDDLLGRQPGFVVILEPGGEGLPQALGKGPAHAADRPDREL